MDTDNLYDILENEVIPTYYDNPEKWQDIVFKAMDDVIPEFTTQRMAEDYYTKLF
jgi:starch phosphorylase